MKKYLLALVMVLVLSGCSALDVQTNYDKDFDFKSLSTFTVLDAKKNDGNDFTRSRINKTLTKHLKNKGYSLVKEEDADFYLKFYLNVKISKETKTDSVTTKGIDLMLYCKPTDNAMTSCLVPYSLLTPPLQTNSTTVTTRTYDYEEGHLVVEVMDVKSRDIVWQGIAVDELSELSKNGEIVIENLLKDFPSK